MRLSGRRGTPVRLILLALLCLSQMAWAQGGSPVSRMPALVLSTLPGPQDDTLRARLKVCLSVGDMRCVVDAYLALEDLGRMPDWLVAFQNAFAVANRRAGECEKVARLIHRGLSEFSQKPVFIRFTVRGEFRVMGFDVIETGVMTKNLQVSTEGYHVAVKLGDKVIDAYTGLAGLPLQDYLLRLSTDPSGHIIYTVMERL